MRLLILGGTQFLGRAVAHAAVTDGHEVVCAARGEAGAVPDSARLVRIDRRDPASYAAIDGTYDAVVDVSSRPSHVRGALAALADRVDHWIYTSSASVYRDVTARGQRVEDSPTHDPAAPEHDDPAADGYANYGPCKIACEDAVRDAVGADRAFCCRAGLIVGPEDTSGRYTYWPTRVAAGGEILAPGTPEDPVQFIDVRDLADWYVRVATERLAGTYDGTGASMPRGEFLDAVAAGVGAHVPRFTWVDDGFLTEASVNPWAGPRSLPLWLPMSEAPGFLDRDVSASLAAGLTSRDPAATARDTLAWSRGLDPATPIPAAGPGLVPADERDVLDRWHARPR